MLGAVIVLELRDALTSAPELSGVVTGAVFVVIVLAFRRGLWATGGAAIRRLGPRVPRSLTRRAERG